MCSKPQYRPLILALLLALPVPALAQNAANSTEELVDQILQDVIGGTNAAAQAEVRRQTGIDPFERGSDPDLEYVPAATNTTSESRRELQQLQGEHNRKIAKLEQELNKKLDKAQAEFEREALKETKPGKITKKKAKLQEKADRAYGKFEEKVSKENRKFDQKRAKILAQDQ